MNLIRIVAILLIASATWATPANAWQKDFADRGKSLIEAPVEGLLDSDFAKRALENDVKKLVENSRQKPFAANKQVLLQLLSAQKKAQLDQETPKPQPEVDNPKVKPGLVEWHADFKTACDASRKSDKPVLLFHLLGKLDQRFT